MLTDRDIVVKAIAKGKAPGEAAIARNLPDEKTGDLVQAISSAP